MRKAGSNAETASGAAERIRLLDLLRGCAVIAMVLYHLIFVFGAVFRFPGFSAAFPLLRPFAPPAIATTFILVSAYSSTLSRGNVKRGARIFAVALGMSAATIFLLPKMGITGAEIRFGILHFLGVAIMLSPLLYKLAGKINFFLGAGVCVVLAVGMRNLYGHGFFGVPVTDPIQSVNVLFPFGIYHAPFYSADFYPIFPWIFVFMIGCFLAVKFPKDRLPAFCYKKTCPPVEFLGRHALLIYVIHQPVIFGIGELIYLMMKK